MLELLNAHLRLPLSFNVGADGTAAIPTLNETIYRHVRISSVCNKPMAPCQRFDAPN
jgi:hypothetical protein